MLQSSDLEGIKRSGTLARRRGEGYFANPYFHEERFLPRTLEEACRLANCWAAGWLEEDAGRDQQIAQVLRVHQQRPGGSVDRVAR